MGMNRNCLAVLASVLMTAAMAAPQAGPVRDPSLAAAEQHRSAAVRQAAGNRAAGAGLKAWCVPQLRAGGAGAAEAAIAAVSAAEAAYRDAAYAPARARPEVLQMLVVQRQCAAFRAARAAPSRVLPVWLLSKLSITQMGPAVPPETGWWVEAKASHADGPVVGSRITFSQGAHMSCFGLSDAKGVVRCRMQDTHPHGPGAWSKADVAAHSGPVIASLAGSVSASRVELPAVAERAMPAPFAAPFAAQFASTLATLPAVRTDTPLATVVRHRSASAKSGRVE
jgi:hypothetical protein